MTELDNALTDLLQSPADQRAQNVFYDMVLNTPFFVPMSCETFLNGEGKEETVNVPVLVESDGDDYLAVFDLKERLEEWTGEETPCVQVPGHMLAEMSSESVRWVMNPGSGHEKIFDLEEIAWLKDVVAFCKAQDGEAGSSCCDEKGS